LATSVLGIIAHKDNYPQGLHQDQGSQFQIGEAPLFVNHAYFLDDVSHLNGGTLIVPGSHRLLADAGSGNEIDFLPPPISITAPGESPNQQGLSLSKLYLNVPLQIVALP
jgi:hypothetical protein